MNYDYLNGIKIGATKYSKSSYLKVLGQYHDGTVAIGGVNRSGLPNWTATVCMPEKPSEGCVWLKDWSENEGVPKALVEAGVVELTGEIQQAGFTSALEARLATL